MLLKAVGFVVCAAVAFGAYKGTVAIVGGTGGVDSIPEHINREFEDLGVPVNPQGGSGYDDPRYPQPYSDFPYRSSPLS